MYAEDAKLHWTLLAGAALLTSVRPATAQYWDGLQPPRADILSCATAYSFVPPSCQDLSEGATCLRAVGGCPTGCNEDTDTAGCSGQKDCAAPNGFECEVGCEYVPEQRAACPVGCREQAGSDNCAECPAAYLVCGAHGGCDPLNPEEDAVSSETLGDEVTCTCLPGFEGSLCNVKHFGATGWFMGIGWLVLCLTILCCLSYNNYFIPSPWNWKYADYHIVPIFGLVIHPDVLVIILEFSQILGFAFADTVPWPDKWAPDTISTKVVRTLKYLTRTIWPQGWDIGFGTKLLSITLLLLMGEVVWRKFKSSPYHDSRGNGQADEHHLLTKLRISAEKMRTVWLMLTVIPAVEIYAAVFFGCTYYVERANTFDADPSLSCWMSVWWWCYAIISGCGLLGVIIAALHQANKRVGSMEQDCPATKQYGFALAMTKITGAIINVAFAEYHARAASAATFAILFALLVLLYTHRPFVHAFLNRLSGFCVGVNLAFYGGALFALERAQPQSTLVADTVLVAVAASFLLYVIGEIVSFQSVPSRASPAGGHGQFHVAWTFGHVYQVAHPGGIPMDSNGRLCAPQYCPHTYRKLRDGSGNPAAISEEYRTGGRPPYHQEGKDRAAKKREYELLKKANKPEMEAALLTASKTRHQLKKEARPKGKTEERDLGAVDTENPIATGTSDQQSKPQTVIETLTQQVAEGSITDAELGLLLNEEGKKSDGTFRLLQRVKELNASGQPTQKISEAEVDAALLEMQDRLKDTNTPNLNARQPLVNLLYYKMCSEYGREQKVLEGLSFPELRTQAIGQGIAQIVVDKAFDERNPRQFLLDIIVKHLDTDGDGDIEDHEVIALRAKVNKHKSTRNMQDVVQGGDGGDGEQDDVDNTARLDPER